jgi:hypothetical protein
MTYHVMTLHHADLLCKLLAFDRERILFGGDNQQILGGPPRISI